MRTSSHREGRQPPLRSNKGGYLRSPFEVNDAFAALAQRHIMATESTRGVSGLAGVSRDHHEDGVDNDGDDATPRPWTRAGVGARGLSAKERRAQQEQAERVYGHAFDQDVMNEEGSKGVGTVAPSALTETTLRTQKHLFALDLRDRSALQKLLPRHLRRPKGDHDGAAVMAVGHNLEVDLHRGEPTGRRRNAGEDDLVLTRGGAVRSASPSDAPPAEVPQTRTMVTAAVATASSSRPGARGMNRMQMLDALRQAALRKAKRRRS